MACIRWKLLFGHGLHTPLGLSRALTIVAFFSTAPLQNSLQKRGLDDSNERPLNYNMKRAFKKTLDGSGENMS